MADIIDIQFLSLSKNKGRELLEDAVVDERIILKLI
jgi:hypothetical protein